MTAFASAAHGVGLVSVPALGAVNLEERVRRAVLRLIEGLLGESVDSGSRSPTPSATRMRERLQELASPLGRPEVRDGRGIHLVVAYRLFMRRAAP